MDQIPVAMAARVLGLTEQGLRAMIRTGRINDASRAGEPAAVLASDVERVLLERRTEASLRQRDAVKFAHQVRRIIWPDEAWERVELADGRVQVLKPPEPYGGPRPARNYGNAALRTLNPDAVALFGRAAVETAAMDRKAWDSSCRWCFADASAKALGGLRPVDSPAYVTLLGADPCERDRARWKTEAAERKEAERQLAVRIAQRRQAATQSAARQEFTAAQQGLQTAAERTRTAARRLAAVDPAVARQTAALAASGHRRRAPGSMPCGCTYARYCPTHTAVFGTSDRSAARR